MQDQHGRLCGERGEEKMQDAPVLGYYTREREVTRLRRDLINLYV